MVLSAKQRLQQEQTRADIPSMIRVNQAGEFGAVQIYRGQQLIFGATSDTGKMIAEMRQHEQQHLDLFNQLLVQRQVRPTLLTPLWRVAGLGLGIVTALMGKQAAMTCTVAVEDAIDQHYAAQAEQLQSGCDPELSAAINQCHAEEILHRDLALNHGGVNSPGQLVLHKLINKGAKLAIWLSTRI